MEKLLTATVDIDAEEVNSFVSQLRSLSWGSVVKIILLAVVLLVLVKLFNQLFARIITRSKIDKSLHGFLRATVKIVLYFIAITIIASSLNVDVTSLIALLSVAGLALSLALQSSLSNLASGIMILTAKPLSVGDYVSVGSDEGTVEEIGLTYTRLATFDRRIIAIPNSTVTSSNVVNYTVEGKRRVDLVFTASYDCDVDAVKSALQEAVASIPDFLQDPEPFARVSGYGESSIEYTVRAWCASGNYWNCYFDLMEEIKRSFDRNGVHMSYPHLNVHMEQ
jgi:small conductance mechanosensitive channel